MTGSGALGPQYWPQTARHTAAVSRGLSGPRASACPPGAALNAHSRVFPGCSAVRELQSLACLEAPDGPCQARTWFGEPGERSRLPLPLSAPWPVNQHLPSVRGRYRHGTRGCGVTTSLPSGPASCSEHPDLAKVPTWGPPDPGGFKTHQQRGSTQVLQVPPGCVCPRGR